MGSKLSKNRLHAIRATLLLLVAGLTFSAWRSASAGIAPGAILISEFRLRGPNGANDEFIEIYNNSTAAHTVQTSDGSAGYALVASDGVARFVIPNGTVIPGRGHYLGVNSVGYSLSSYPAGKGKTATGDITYTVDIPDNAGIALFNTANPANFTQANRLDAVGSTSEPNFLYKEGTGYPALTPFSIDYSFYRNLSNGLPRDTGVNVLDFVFVDTNGTSAGAGQRLGAPGPENLSSPIRRKGENAISRIAPGKCVGCSPNYVHDSASDPASNAKFGKLDIRRKFTNTSNTAVKRLRFRITDISTFPAPSGTADLRPISSTDVSIPQGNVILQVKGTTLEQAPSQPNGGGFNSSMSVDAVTTAQPLAPGASIDFRLLLGVQQSGRYRFAIQVETFPVTSQSVYMMVGDTESGHFEARPAGDFDGDFITDFATWRPSTGTWVISKSTTNGGLVSKVFGQNGDRPAPADYDGDGQCDLAVFRPGDQSFHILQSSDNTEKVKQLGQATDVPAPGDYDGDGKADAAVYRPANSTFYVLKSSNNTSFSKKWGAPGDVAVPCDYDGDHRTDFVIYRPSTGDWIIFKSSTNTGVKQNVGVSGTPATGDFDGDGRDDLSVLVTVNSGWYVKRSSGQGFIFQSWGGPGDVPQPGDYDGDGHADFSVWRDSTHQFLVAPSGGWSFDKSLGKTGDLPVSTAMVTP
jgi:hypothetical protein